MDDPGVDDVERAAGLGVPTLTRLELAARTGVDPEQSKRFWRAMGFPDLPDAEVALTEIDVRTVENLAALLASGVTRADVAVQMTRVLGQSLSRAAEAHVEVLLEGIDALAPGEVDERRRLLLESVEGMSPVMEGFLVYLWRRHVAAATRRALTAGAHPTGRMLAVGFADLVGFTARSQQLDEGEIAAMVGRFESITNDAVVSHGGRVVKMIGDEVMFLGDRPGDAVRIGLDIADACGADALIPDVRVGLAWGATVQQEGDHFGPTVNMASRLVHVAYPGSVLVSDGLHTEVAELAGVRWKRVRPQQLKGIGRVAAWVAERDPAHSSDARV